MKKKQILITGGNGQLAKVFKSVFSKYDMYELLFLEKNKLDITSSKNVNSCFKKYKPDIVLHFASLTRRLECASTPDLAYKINFLGTKNIVDACNKINSTLLFVSTNEVFSGKKNTKYYEDDIPDPVTTVGKTKYQAEQYIRKNLKKYFIIRTSWLYSKYTKNFLQTIVEIAKKKLLIKLVTDEYGSPTNTKDLALIIEQLLQSKKYGIYHVSNKGFVSRYEFGKFVLDFLKIPVIISESKLGDFNFIENPPKKSALGDSKLSELDLSMRSWKKALEEFLIEDFGSHE